MIHLPASMALEIEPRLLGDYRPEDGTEVPVMGSFIPVTRPGGGPEPTLAWAKLRLEDGGLRAGLAWLMAGREHVFRFPEDSPLELAYAAVLKPCGALDRILFLVIRVRGTVQG